MPEPTTPPALQQQPPIAECWACHSHVQVPLCGEPPQVEAPAFKCGWCGAVTETFAARQQKLLARSRRSALVRLWKACLNLQYFLVAFVLVLIASIVLLGTAFVLPTVCTSLPLFLAGHALTMVLTFMVLFNFFASLMCSPGTVSKCFHLGVGPDGTVPQGAFENHCYCFECKSHKPPGVRHCSTCRRCIVAMDHHCPFVGNCVGCGNMRNFLHFKIWAMISVVFSASISATLIGREYEWRNFIKLVTASWRIAREDRSPFVFVAVFLSKCPTYFLAALYVLVMSILIFCTIFALFINVLRHLLSNSSAVRVPKPSINQGARVSADMLLRSSRGPANRAMQPLVEADGSSFTVVMDDLTLALGGRGLRAWLFPLWGPAHSHPRFVTLPCTADKKAC